MVKILPASEGDIRNSDSIRGSGRSPGGGHDNSLQYSGLENLKDRGAWKAIVHEVAKYPTLLWEDMGHIEERDTVFILK